MLVAKPEPLMVLAELSEVSPTPNNVTEVTINALHELGHLLGPWVVGIAVVGRRGAIGL